MLLSGGTVYDPRHGVDGVQKDIWIRDGRIVSPPTDNSVDIVKHDLNGRVVMPGAIDMHCHVAGPKVNTARMMQPEQMRRVSSRVDFDAPMSSVPDIHTTGLRYTGLGYTSCFDAAVTPLASRMMQLELDALPNLDKGFYVLVGNNHFAMEQIRSNRPEQLQAFLGYLIERCGAYALKLVNPGGVEMWKQRAHGNVRDLSTSIDGFDVTPRQIVTEITKAANALALPHPVHIHCNNLGIPGNFSTTLETLKLVQGHHAHLAHVQFHSYGGGGDKEDGLCSKVQPLVEFVNDNPGLSVDVGQVMFDRTTSLTGDGPLGYYLQSLGGEKWFSVDIELESGCGISPIEYRNKNFVHSLQWAIGLEWFLSAQNPWQVAMSSDHPNGGSFLAYPKIIRLLMDNAYRQEQLKSVHPRVLKHSPLIDIEREYSLFEIAIITRAGPAKILGLENKGHLGVGADADVTIYTPDDNIETMFAWPMMVMKSGQVLMSDGEFRSQGKGGFLQCSPNYDVAYNGRVESWYEDHYSVPLRKISRK